MAACNHSIRVILNLQQWQRARRQREGVQPQYRFLFKQSFSGHWDNTRTFFVRLCPMWRKRRTNYQEPDDLTAAGSLSDGRIVMYSPHMSRQYVNKSRKVRVLRTWNGWYFHSITNVVIKKRDSNKKCVVVLQQKTCVCKHLLNKMQFERKITSCSKHAWCVWAFTM